MFRSFAWSLILLYTIGISSCVKDDNNSTISPLISVVHAVNDIPGFIQIQISDSTIFREKVAFGQSVSPKSLPSGTHTITYFESVISNPLFATSLNLEGGKNYTAFLCNSRLAPDHLIIENNYSLKDSNNTSYRFVNMIPGISLDVSISGNPTVYTLPFKNTSSSIENSTSSVAVLVRKTGSTSALLTIPKLTGAKNKQYLIYFYGSSSSPQVNLFSVK